MDKPHWHEVNPWKDQLVYVPIEELAGCSLRLEDPHNTWAMIETIAHWAQYGPKLDAYILINTTLVSAGVRYGPEGHHYLSPALSLPKVMALRAKYLNQEEHSVPREGAIPGV
jgi:hypothetical protein